MLSDERFAFASSRVAISVHDDAGERDDDASSQPPGSGGLISRSIAPKTIRPASTSSVAPFACAESTSIRRRPKVRLPARGPSDEPDHDEREQQRAGVGEHVRGVREQRERVGEDARDHLDDHERDDQCERRSSSRRASVSGPTTVWTWPIVAVAVVVPTSGGRARARSALSESSDSPRRRDRCRVSAPRRAQCRAVDGLQPNEASASGHHDEVGMALADELDRLVARRGTADDVKRSSSSRVDWISSRVVVVLREDHAQRAVGTPGA